MGWLSLSEAHLGKYLLWTTLLEGADENHLHQRGCNQQKV